MRVVPLKTFSPARYFRISSLVMAFLGMLTKGFPLFVSFFLTVLSSSSLRAILSSASSARQRLFRL